MIIKNAYIYKNKEFRLVNIHINKKGIISDITTTNDLHTDAHIFDSEKKLIIPGFINAHIHLGETILSKKISEGLNLNEYISSTNKIFIDNPVLEKSRSVACKYTAMDALLNGTATIAGARIDEYSKFVGLRSYSGYILMNSSKLGKYLNNFEENITKVIHSESDLHKHFIFIHSINHIDESLLPKIKKILEKYKNLKLMIHVAETKESEEEVLKKYGISTVAILYKYNLLSENTFLIHANCISKTDLKKIIEKGSYIVHCPSTNLYLDKKIIPSEFIKQIKNKFIIATDGVATAGTTSLLSEARLAYLFHNSKKQIFNFEECMNMITKIPAEALGIENYSNEINIGMPADLILLENNKINIGAENLFKELILQEKNHEISSVIIGGKLIMKDKIHTKIDMNNILNNFTKLSKKLD